MAVKSVDFGSKTGYDSVVNTYLILSWAFFLVSVICALMITSVKSPLTRKYRKILISTAFSGMILGVATWSMPLILRKVNPVQSRKIPLENLPVTNWEEPLENPVVALESAEEMAWMKNLPENGKARFKFKLKLTNDFSQPLIVQDNQFIYLDHDGNLRGFDPYNGLNHWTIETRLQTIVEMVIAPKRLFLIDTPKNESIRISCIDLQSPSILWQRIIPESKEASAIFDFENQSLVVSAGADGVWALKSKTGEIFWKKPEIFTKTKLLHTGKTLVAFEPPVGKKTGTWYSLDPLSGKILQKQNHVYPGMESFTPIQTAEGMHALAQVSGTGYFLLNPNDLSVKWTETTTERIEAIHLVDERTFLVANGDHLLELRELVTGARIWQKKLPQVDLSKLKVDLKKKWIAAPIVDDGSGVVFYSLEDGNYLFTAETPEPAKAVLFFGDWFYLLSETFAVAFQG